MPNFHAHGSTGQAPTTVFFGPIPDRFNLLIPAIPPHQVDKQFAANNINQWSIYTTGSPDVDTVSLGSFTTAPDGTNTAQKVIETTTNSFHALTAAPLVGETPGFLYDMRLAVFAKAAERTRIVLNVQQTSSPFNYCRTVFDLAGGQIGVAGSASSSSGLDLVALQDMILPFGAGWYLCMTDVRCNAGAVEATMLAWFEIDSGSGTGAINNSYTGNGTSGVYTWRSTMMPPAAWGMSGQRVFFDDFTDPTLSQIDLTNSRADGFTWYLNNEWPGYRSGGSPGSPGSPNDPTDPAIFAFSAPSYLKIISHDTGFNTLGLGSAAWDGGTSYVGTGHQLSNRLIETRVKWANDGSDLQVAAWSSVINDLLHPKFDADFAHQYRELDFIEIVPSIPNNTSQSTFISGTFILGAVDQTAIILTDQIGAAAWSPLVSYVAGPPANTLVHYNGVIYEAIANGANHQPDISPTFWQTPPGATVLLPANAADIAQYDPNEFNTYSILWLEATPGHAGGAYTFFNGVHCRGLSNRGPSIHYGPAKTFDNSCNIKLMEGQKFILWLTALFPNTYWDWISITE